MKPVPGVKKVGDHCCSRYYLLPLLPHFFSSRPMASISGEAGASPNTRPKKLTTIGLSQLMGVPFPFHRWFGHGQVMQIWWMSGEENLLEGFLEGVLTLQEFTGKDGLFWMFPCLNVMLETTAAILPPWEGFHLWSRPTYGRGSNRGFCGLLDQNFCGPLWDHWATELPNSGASMLLVFLL